MTVEAQVKMMSINSKPVKTLFINFTGEWLKIKIKLVLPDQSQLYSKLARADSARVTPTSQKFLPVMETTEPSSHTQEARLVLS